MSSFSNLERSLAKLLHRTPQVKRFLKASYQAINYFAYAERGFRYSVSENIDLNTPSTLIGQAEPDADAAEFCGYFDYSPWSACGRYFVTHRVSSGSVAADIVVYDFLEKSSITVASTPAWTWQQGAMCRWMDVNGEELLGFNQVENETLGTTLLTPTGLRRRHIEMPLQAVNDRRFKLYSINYLRLGKNGTEYGYSLPAQNLSPDAATDTDGIWSVDMTSDEIRLIVTLAQLIENEPRPEMNNADHEVNHISVSPDGNRFAFVHRFRGALGQFSRLYVAAHDGTSCDLALDDDMVSHYTWIDNETLLTWSRKRPGGDSYYRINVNTKIAEVFCSQSLTAHGDGHPTFAEGRGVVTDTYPDRRRQQHLLLPTSGEEIDVLARFLSPLRFSGAQRVDLHPRWHPNDRAISVDASFTGQRRTYILNLPY